MPIFKYEWTLVRTVIPAKAGIQHSALIVLPLSPRPGKSWIPAFAGMTSSGSAFTEEMMR